MDPGTALGIASLVYDVSKDLYNFYRVWKDCEKDVKELRMQLLWLHKAFKVVRDTVQKPALSDSGRDLIYSAINDCNDAANDLQAELEKVKSQTSPRNALEKLKAQGRIACYPFKKPTIAGIAKNVESCREALHLAADLLGLDTIANMSLSLQAIDEMLIDGFDNMDTNLVLLQTKVDLRNLTSAKGATYDSLAEGDLPRCLPGTRVELLNDIASWGADKAGKRIFWLCGMAGTGKSTISRTVSQKLKDENRTFATFFFKRGEAERKDARLFVPTIAEQLAGTLPGLARIIGRALESDRSLCGKHLAVQFNDLLLRPMQEGLHRSHVPDQIFIVMDALDECEDTSAIEAILILFKRLEEVATTKVRIFVTSRPEVPIISGFRELSHDWYHDIRLEEAQVQSIRSDLSMFVQHKFMRIKEDYPAKHPFTALPAGWPHDDSKYALVERAHPLFIVAFTLCTSVEVAKDPKGQLDWILAQQRGFGSRTALADTYLPILRQAVSAKNKETQHDNLDTLQAILGPLVLVSNPLSVEALTMLLQVSVHEVEPLLVNLQSVLSVPKSMQAPVKLFHLSFRDFLVDPELQKKTRRLRR
ncbi:hypothetical protein KC316_g1743 [Hortaea werneckii]|nr:hypothetical protein KC324_g1644 [Hortaea werneckii]KAI7593420.1 hypothetical protein KC316_g1743 [Hortaea werneckii]